MNAGPADLQDTLDALPLVDHHVHGALRVPLDRARFERTITESDRAPAPGVSTFDSQIGFAILRWCAPVLDLGRHPSPDEYLARRAELGPGEVNRRFLSGAGVDWFLVDTGFAADELLDVGGVADAAGGSTQAREIVRLEGLAEEAVRVDMDPSSFADEVVSRLRARLEAGAVGTKSVVAYRCGFGIDTSRPSETAVADAARRWFSEMEAGAPVRVSDAVLEAFLLWTGIDARVPLQIHVGFGDSDLRLHEVNPSLLTDFIKEAEPSGTPIMLLHCYPYQREAGYLAHIYPNVYFDVGVAVNYTGTQSLQVVAESFEVGPFGKQVYSSDAWGPAELHYLGAVLWRRAVASVLGDWVAAGDWSVDDARRVVRMVGVDTAARLYGLP
jgi:predicted TIM-barrel fold metal-dependent hydrolase